MLAEKNQHVILANCPREKTPDKEMIYGHDIRKIVKLNRNTKFLTVLHQIRRANGNKVSASLKLVFIFIQSG